MMMKGLRYFFIVSIFLLLAATMMVTKVSASTYILPADADATIMYGRWTQADGFTEDRRDKNYGSGDKIQINRGGTMDNNQKAYIRFVNDQNFISMALESAKLQFTVDSTNGGEISIYGLTGEANVQQWEEGTENGTTVWPDSKCITWNNAPGNQTSGYSVDTNFIYNRTAIGKITVGSTGDYTVDVTNYIKSINGQKATFILVGAANSGCTTVISKDNLLGEGPKLVLVNDESKNSFIQNSSYGIDQSSLLIKDVALETPLQVFLDRIETFNGAQKTVLDNDAITSVTEGVIQDGMKLKVTSQSGNETTIYTVNALEYLIGQVSITVNNQELPFLAPGKIAASVKVENYKADTATLVLAVYKNRQLLKCITDVRPAIMGEATLLCSIDILDSEGIIVKVMLLEELGSIRPLCKFTSFAEAPKFNHPGIFQSQSELDFMKASVNGISNHPMKTGYTKMNSDTHSSLSYVYQAYPIVHVEPSGSNDEETHFRGDAEAAYANALNWVITGEDTYKNKCIEILNAWSYMCTDIVCDTNVQQPTLEAAWALPMWVSAAEIIRFYNNGSAGWAVNDVNQFKDFVIMLKNKAIGSCSSAPNWRASRALACMSAGVFLDDWDLYHQGYNEADYQISLIDSEGKPSENARDFVHAQYNVIATSQAAEIAFHQNNSALYNKRLEGELASVNPLLWRQSEYFVRQMMGNVPEGGINYSSGNKRNPPYEMILTRYKNNFAMSMPYTEQFVTVYNRPVDVSESHFMGWTTLTHAELKP